MVEDFLRSVVVLLMFVRIWEHGRARQIELQHAYVTRQPG
jgi:hypothetical protein